MSDRPLREYLDELRTLLGRATPGPFYVALPADDGEPYYVETEYDGGLPVAGVDPHRPADAYRMSAALNLLTPLLEVVEAAGGALGWVANDIKRSALQARLSALHAALARELEEK